MLPIPVGYMLPFQFVRPGGMAAQPITSFRIVNEDGSTNERILSVSDQIDYITTPDGNYSIVRFRGSAPVSSVQEEGWKRAIVEDGVNTWYSDYFLWTNTPLVKVTWWHSCDVETDIGPIVYSGGFRYWAFFRVEIGKPQYPFEEEVDRRGGVDYPFRETSYKQYAMTLAVSEYLMDCLRLLPLHSNVKINHLGDEINVSQIRHGEVSWIERGDIARSAWTFRTNTVVSTYGKATAVIADTNCYPATYTADRLFDDIYGALSDSEVLNYVSQFDPGTYILYRRNGGPNTSLYFNPGNGSQPYEEYVEQGDVIIDNSTKTYYLSSSFQGGSTAEVKIYSVGIAPDYTIEAVVLPLTTIRIEKQLVTGEWEEIASLASSAWPFPGYNLSAQASPGGSIRLVFSTAICGDFFTTQPFVISSNIPELQGIGYDTIGLDEMVY